MLEPPRLRERRRLNEGCRVASGDCLSVVVAGVECAHAVARVGGCMVGAVMRSIVRVGGHGEAEGSIHSH